ncbi:putative glucan endo-1,3-beta-D-glucosidase [Lupinus albus]|uniref:Putative glucan endo-1,3-beta-D-glucosidase n=1 Tax=Lupinus albus TaxID=3870 RepID=A0A6A4NTH4_LUPAL|nr:putative glucan endo-1,3-beta-D-glucosidase [Lupinus albus]
MEWYPLTDSWCIAKYTTNDTQLMNNILYACDVLDNCKMIQQGGSCFIPDILLNHASVVMNEYYAKKGRNPWNCYFSDSGLISNTEPSYGSCKYA